MNRQYAVDVIDDLYLEGDRDHIFLEQIVGLIQYDREDRLRGKSDAEIRDGSIELIKFLTEAGDFDLALGNKIGDGVEFELYDGSLEKLICVALSSESSVDYQYRVVLRKVRMGAAAPPVPERIIGLMA